MEKKSFSVPDLASSDKSKRAIKTGRILIMEQSATDQMKSKFKLITAKDDETSIEISTIKPLNLPLSQIKVVSLKCAKNIDTNHPYNPPNRQTATRNHNSEANMRRIVVMGEIADQM